MPCRHNWVPIFLSILFLVVFSTGAKAQEVTDYVRVAPTPDWVVQDEIADTPFEMADGLQLGYQLLSYQSKVTAKSQDKHRYRRFVVDIQTTGGLEDYGTLTVTFDPSYQTVDFHDISILRDGSRIKLLDLSAFEIYRVETDRDKLLYNGDLQIGFSVPGLKVGDQLDYSYTLKGINPALRGSFYNRNVFEYGVPIQKLRARLVLAQGVDYYLKSHNQAPEPRISNLKNATVLDWVVEDIKAKELDDDRPVWHYSRPVYEISGVETWRDVGAHFSPSYDVSKRPDASVQAIIDTIAAETADPKIRSRKALSFVQSNIRYLGIELGVGGYIPRSPELTLARKFGDCKDVTYLLLTMLEGLGVEANALLVETEERGEFIRALPGYSMFDHVIVRAMIGDEDYFLDATRGEQLGDLDHLGQGFIGKGLLLDGAQSRVVSAGPADIEWHKDFVDEYDLVGHPDDITLKITLNYFGVDADSNKNWYESDGLKSVEKTYLDYFADFYPSIEQVKPIEFSEDMQAGSFSVAMEYLIKEAWEVEEDGKNKTFWAIPYEVKADMPSFSGAKRSSPFSIEFPNKTRQKLRFLVEEGWNLDLHPSEIKTDSFEYIREETYEGTVYEETYSYITKRDFIPLEGFAEIMTEISEARDAYGVTMTMPVEGVSSDFDTWIDEKGEAVIGIVFALCALLALIGAFLHRNYDLAWREEVILHPVGLKKFIFLSFWTYGIYQIYWFYKNWQWIKTVDNQDIWPAARSFFAPIMNFDLFRRIEVAGEERSVSGYRWYGGWATPLALLYILLVFVDRMIDKLEGISDIWLLSGFLYLLVPIPVAMQVLKYNTGKEEYVAKHNRFSLQTWLLVILFAPIASAIYLGFGVILYDSFQ